MKIKRFNEDYDVEQPYETKEEFLEFIDDLLLWFFDEKIDYVIKDTNIDKEGTLIWLKTSGTKPCTLIEFKLESKYVNTNYDLNISKLIDILKEIEQVRKRLVGKKYDVIIRSESKYNLSNDINLIIYKRDENFAENQVLNDDYAKIRYKPQNTGFRTGDVKLSDGSIIINTDSTFITKVRDKNDPKANTWGWSMKNINNDVTEEVLRKFIKSCLVDPTKYAITKEDGESRTVFFPDNNGRRTKSEMPTFIWTLKLK